MCGMMKATSGYSVGDQLDDRYLADRIVQHRHAERARDLANLAADARVVAVHLDADEAVLLDGALTMSCTRPRSRAACTKAKPIEAIGAARDDARDLPVRDRIVGMKGRKDHRALDTGAGGPTQVLLERRRGVPGTGQAVAFAGMAVAIDDHDCSPKLAPTIAARAAGRRPSSDGAARAIWASSY